VFTLEDNEETKKLFPAFKVSFSVQVTATSLKLKYHVEPKEEQLR
jgi:hypothetical protein